MLHKQDAERKINSHLDNVWTVELPIWIPGFRGNFSYGDVSIEGEDGSTPPPPTPENPIEPGEGLGGDILSRLFNKNSFLKFFYMGKISYRPNRFLFQFDGFGGSAGSGITFNYNNKELVKASYSFAILHLYIGWSLFQNIDYIKNKKINIYLYTGIRNITAKINTELNEGKIKFAINPTWQEILLGINANYQVNHWNLNIKGDFGTYTLHSSTFSYKIQFSAYYKVGKITSLRFGWTDLDLKHDSLFNDKQLIITTHLSGPNFGIAFYF